MPLASIKLRPGQDAEATPTLDTTGYISISLGRFKAGLFQKLGGWTKYFDFSVPGAMKALHAWQDLNSDKRLAIATTEQLGVILDGTYSDLTPQTFGSSFTPDFSTTNTSTTVEVDDPNISGVTVYDSVFFNTPVSVGGIILSGIYPIATITGATSYTIEASTAATATVNNGGAVPEFDTTSGGATVDVTFEDHGLVEGSVVYFQTATTLGGITIQGKYTVTSVTSADVFVITANMAASSTANAFMNSGEADIVYYIALGPQSGGAGYGLGDYGEGGYGLGTQIAGQEGNPLASTDWTLDNWGEILLACAENGGVYYWSPTGGFQNMALVSSGPLFNTGAFVSMAQQMVITYGSSIDARTLDAGGIGVYQDPLLVQWSDISNFFEWTASITTQAGNFRIPNGSKIVGGCAASNVNLIWTDVDCWAMDYIGPDLVYSFNKIGANCGLIGKHAVAQLGLETFWMGKNNFFRKGGAGVQIMPCTVWDAVFQDLDLANAHKCVAGSNTAFTEVFFFYPSISGGLGYPDKYAKFNPLENTWDTGPLDRAAWLDQGILENPIGATTGGLIYAHEDGFDADGSPLTPSFTTGWFYLTEGRDIVFCDKILPDFRWGLYASDQDANISITVEGVMYPGDTPRTYGPYNFTQASQFADTRIRARQIRFTVSSSDIGSFWRLGLVRFRYAPDGRR